MGQYSRSSVPYIFRQVLQCWQIWRPLEALCCAQVDSCSALVEDAEGNLDILHWMDHYKEPALTSPARSSCADSDDVSDTESAVSQQAALLFDVLSLGSSSGRGSLLPKEKQGSPK